MPNTPHKTVRVESDARSSYPWIRAALRAGGALTVRPVIPGKEIFRATMSWPGESPVSGNIAMDLHGTLQNLDANLLEDASRDPANAAGA